MIPPKRRLRSSRADLGADPLAGGRARAGLVTLLALTCGCPRETPKPVIGDLRDSHEVREARPEPTASGDAGAAPVAVATDAAAGDADLSVAIASDDVAALHRGTKAELLELFPIATKTERAHAQAEAFLSWSVGPQVGRISQGNKDNARHEVSKRACLAGLKNVPAQTEEQKARCGAENMVPIYKNGDPSSAKTCIDQFEFPNRACELPMVWAAPTQAEHVCQIAGKRLCTQDEWTLACKGDPEGKKDSVYAYGDTLDLTICNTNKPHPFGPDGHNWICYVHDAQSAWKTCETDTEPSGAFPMCRSRFGVFDLHGNVAEIMTRGALSQLKGSAFFYVDVARKHDQPQPKDALRETYPDHCNYDPRWHVESMDNAQHVNYHLGFRCCKSL